MTAFFLISTVTIADYNDNCSVSSSRTNHLVSTQVTSLTIASLITPSTSSATMHLQSMQSIEQSETPQFSSSCACSNRCDTIVASSQLTTVILAGQ